MSAEQTITLTCDAEPVPDGSCLGKFQSKQRSFRDARVAAEKDGWRTEPTPKFDVLDFCPLHAKARGLA
jgi:hypothetical protein